MNFSLFCRLNNAASRNIIDPVIRIIRFLKVIIAQVVSLTSRGILNGLRNTFHWLLFNVSLRIRNISPNTIITTAVPFPFLMIVESIKAITPRKITGSITCNVIFTMRNLTINTEDNCVKASMMRKAIMNISTILTSQTLYL